MACIYHDAARAVRQKGRYGNGQPTVPGTFSSSNETRYTAIHNVEYTTGRVVSSFYRRRGIAIGATTILHHRTAIAAAAAAACCWGLQYISKSVTNS